MPASFRPHLGSDVSEYVSGPIAYRASDNAAEITDPVTGIREDRTQRWTHPQPAITGHQDGGWTYAVLQDQSPRRSASNSSQSAKKFPPLPEDLKRRMPTT